MKKKYIKLEFLVECKKKEKQSAGGGGGALEGLSQSLWTWLPLAFRKGTVAVAACRHASLSWVHEVQLITTNAIIY